MWGNKDCDFARDARLKPAPAQRLEQVDPLAALPLHVVQRRAACPLSLALRRRLSVTGRGWRRRQAVRVQVDNLIEGGAPCAQCLCFIVLNKKKSHQ
jgi:hypothetical protein